VQGRQELAVKITDKGLGEDKWGCSWIQVTMEGKKEKVHTWKQVLLEDWKG
jgi:hypothetical protein